MKENYHIALAGNPNCGKTTLFNGLTGSNQKVGNWPGVTVESSRGICSFGGKSFRITDLPGIYDLQPDSDDQRVTGEFLQKGGYDLVVNVVDACSLSRNLYLTMDILKRTDRVVILLNMMDLARQEGILIDHELLSRELGIPVIPVVSIDSRSVMEAREALSALFDKGNFPKGFLKDRDLSSREMYDTVDRVCRRAVTHTAEGDSFSDKVDRIVLNRYLSIPILLFMMYTIFWLAIGGGSVFIDFFDILSGLLFVDLVDLGLGSMNCPPWIRFIIARGIGTGIQTVATFIPVVFFLFLAIGIMEDFGYLARISVITDRFMRKIGLPGNAFLPLIIGLGCTVPAVMACRTLKSKRDRFMTIFITPFMSCGARIPVYALFCQALFPSRTGIVVFLLYLSGVFMAILSGFFLKDTLFPGRESDFIIELPPYHVPRPLPIIRNALNRMGFFVKRAGRVLILAVFILSFLNSISYNKGRLEVTPGENENTLLTAAGKAVTPLFSPMGIGEDNWEASVALFSGLFAKEAIVGTVNSLYSQNSPMEMELDEGEKPDPLSLIKDTVLAAFHALYSDFIALFSEGDLLGLSLAGKSQSALEEELETDAMVFMQLRAHFTPLSGYAYLLFVLLYFPCLAVVGAAKQEMGGLYALLMVIYSTLLAWCTATSFYQIAEGHNLPLLLTALSLLILMLFIFYGIGRRLPELNGTGGESHGSE